MRRRMSALSLFSVLALILGTVAPLAVAAEEVPTVRVDVQVTGYTGGSWGGFGGIINCGPSPLMVGFEVDASSGTGHADLDIPAGLTCTIQEFHLGNPGWNGEFEEPQISPGHLTTIAGQTGVFDVTIERTYTGDWPPQTDSWTEVTYDLLTVDRVYLNKYGGITAEGRIQCSPVGVRPEDSAIYANVNWTALQYAGKKTAITASYDSARAEICWTPTMTKPDTWQTYPPITPGPGIQWIYSTDGVFGSGSIRMTIGAYGGYSRIFQNFEPSPAGTDWPPYRAGCQDDNGDGFCAYEVLINGSIQTVLKPIRVR